MQNLEQELREEMERIKREKEEEAVVLRREAEEKVTQATACLTVLREQLSVIEPEMVALKREYKALKKQCQAMPHLIQHSIKEATKQVGCQWEFPGSFIPGDSDISFVSVAF